MLFQQCHVQEVICLPAKVIRRIQRLQENLQSQLLITVTLLKDLMMGGKILVE